jgi:hypothetical protein
MVVHQTVDITNISRNIRNSLKKFLDKNLMGYDGASNKDKIHSFVCLKLNMSRLTNKFKTKYSRTFR